ncbi:MAG: hypothetical protein WBD47_01340 [Phormidesmis sp.]
MHLPKLLKSSTFFQSADSRDEDSDNEEARNDLPEESSAFSSSSQAENMDSASDDVMCLVYPDGRVKTVSP